MSRPADSAGERTRVPEAEQPAARTEEQEVAGGRTASTPFAALGSVFFLVAVVVAVVVGIAVLAIYLA
jgi:hypothetical protein